MLKLSHGDQIRIAALTHNKTTVGTIRGYCLQRNAENPNGPQRDPEQAVEQQRKFGNSVHPWTSQAASVLDDCPDPIKRAHEVFLQASAPCVNEGQIVLIEGVVYKVRILGMRYSDPVKFDPLERVDTSAPYWEEALAVRLADGVTHAIWVVCCAENTFYGQVAAQSFDAQLAAVAYAAEMAEKGFQVVKTDLYVW